MSEIEWIPVKLRDATDDEVKMYCCHKVVDSEIPNDGEEVLITNDYGRVTTDIFEAYYGAFRYYDWEKIVAWAHFPKAYVRE